LTNNGEMRADPESIKKFHEILIEKCKELSLKYQESARNDKRKTIQGNKDFNDKEIADDDEDETDESEEDED